ncbi:3D domain-containing protein, partial [Patescibacteria group bacterium]|nr:3D domain-containing protein [Patescibacteria group bacterium]
YLKLKKLVLSGKPYSWSSYLVLAGLCIKLATPYVPVVLAEQASSYDYSLLAVQAIQSPNFMDLISAQDENNFILRGNNFVQAFSPIGYSGSFLTDRPVAAPVVRTAVEAVGRVIVTAYSSTPDQTDSTPFITANGTYVYDGLVACNFLSFHTKVKFPEIYGDKIFIVEDRMAKKNSHKMDIWMPTREAALQFGVKKLAYEIVK